MDWYGKLIDYFPQKEMKSKEHFELLFSEKRGTYKKEEGTDYVLIYLEKTEFIFIDYILVSGSSRGKGTGSKLLDRMKRKRKAIILEVDPITEADPDSSKRVAFYNKNGLHKVDSITYERIHAITKELIRMDIFCWSPSPKSDFWVFERMKTAYKEAHSYKAAEIYNTSIQAADEVLTFNGRKLSKAE
ncbi:GNAT family N-acetyltransferase [Bacillus sp. T33-2]|uniref:GNAT family N-acetyltransferase n=1 Tax=Bacillus sp. T33-2 TaxID=2054168 RepID=UPI000C75A0FA|nr:GNAT family N-acetyltransferase [Bacillus sp. T33-2]PLR96844.1 GNAT family N-acetyltransferase [Bacillus sp. T33-2]